jgi:hypothetical protein
MLKPFDHDVFKTFWNQCFWQHMSACSTSFLSAPGHQTIQLLKLCGRFTSDKSCIPSNRLGSSKGENSLNFFAPVIHLDSLMLSDEYSGRVFLGEFESPGRNSTNLNAQFSLALDFESCSFVIMQLTRTNNMQTKKFSNWRIRFTDTELDNVPVITHCRFTIPTCGNLFLPVRLLVWADGRGTVKQADSPARAELQGTPKQKLLQQKNIQKDHWVEHREMLICCLYVCPDM